LSEIQDVREREKLANPASDGDYITLERIGEIKRRLGDAATAVELQKTALQMSQKQNGEASRYTAMAHHLLGLALRDVADAVGAERELRAALASYVAYLPPRGEHPLAATTRYELGKLLALRPDSNAEAASLLGDVVAIREKFLGPGDARTLEGRVALAQIKR
jgi:hypothetical protein